MKEILALIENKKHYFSESPLFAFMKDARIDANKKLIFAPCMSHFIMSFSDLNKYVLRLENTDNPVQKIVNQYTFEDDNHWPWFLADLNQLEFNETNSFTNFLAFIWSEETRITRQISYLVAGYALNAEPEIKLVIIEVLEATADVFFSVSRDIAWELENSTHNKELLFFGNLHLHEEVGHTMSSEDSQHLIVEIELTPSQKTYAVEVVEKIFEIFTEWTYELLEYALAHTLEPISYEAETISCELHPAMSKKIPCDYAAKI